MNINEVIEGANATEYKLEVWYFHGDMEKYNIYETIKANSLKEAIAQVKIKHPWRIYCQPPTDKSSGLEGKV